MKKTYKITEKDNGITVRDYIRSSLGFSARVLKSLKYHGSISVDGNKVFADFLLQSGSVLELDFPEENSETIAPENIPLEIIFEDENFLAVNKPAYMPVHPSQGHRSGTLANGVMYLYRNEPFVFRVLTRLDGDTTGVVIIAKNAVAANAFSKCNPHKKYLAICTGSPAEKQGEINAPIARAEGVIKRCVKIGGKPSTTKYEVIKEKDGLSLVRAIPVTGRTHQIRVHMSHIGCPLHGDFLYGKEIPGERTKLHCESVSFLHPFTNKATVISASLPKDFDSFL